MIGSAEIQRSITGAWRMFLNKPDAMRFFDTSLEGFWRSFQAIVLVAPFYLLIAVSERTGQYGDAIASGQINIGIFWATEVLTFVVDWVTLPALLAAVASFVGIKRQYPAYIVVRNWAAPIMVAPFAAVSLLGRFGLSDDLLFVPSLAALAFALRFGYLIARQTLNAGMDVAIALVVLDVLVSLMVVKVIGRLTGVELAG